MVIIEVKAKFHILFLGLLLLTQFTFGNVLPVRESDVDDNPALKTNNSNKDVEFKNSTNIEPKSLFAYIEIYIASHDDLECKESLPKEHFEKFEYLGISVYEQLTIFGDYLLHELQSLFAKIIEEGSSQASLKEKLEQFKQLQKDFIKVENINNTFDKFDTIKDAVELLHQYNLTNVKKPTEEAVLIVDILKKLNLETLIKQSDKKAKEFKENIISKAEEYINSLTPEERKNGKSFDDWLKKFKNSHIDLLFELFELYCLAKK